METATPQSGEDRSARAEVASASKLLRAAVALLARRDFSRAGLRERLLRRFGAAAEPELDRVLDRLEIDGLLSEERFAENFVRARASRFGPARLRHELLRRGLPAERIDSALKLHAQDEYSAARAIWARRFASTPFASIPADARERARQARFLSARGFSHEVIRRLLRELEKSPGC